MAPGGKTVKWMNKQNPKTSTTLICCMQID